MNPKDRKASSPRAIHPDDPQRLDQQHLQAKASHIARYNEPWYTPILRKPACILPVGNPTDPAILHWGIPRDQIPMSIVDYMRPIMQFCSTSARLFSERISQVLVEISLTLKTVALCASYQDFNSLGILHRGKYCSEIRSRAWKVWLGVRQHIASGLHGLLHLLIGHSIEHLADRVPGNTCHK